MFGATNIVKNSDKSNQKYSGNEIAFYGAGPWSFGNDFARNVVIFCVDNLSSSHIDSRKYNFLSVKWRTTHDIDCSIGAAV